MKSEELRKKSHLQFITHYTERYTYLDSAQMALEGGCQWIQLRMKECPLDEIEKTAIKIKEMCLAHNAVFIIDDHVELAKSIGADGVHLGHRKLLNEVIAIAAELDAVPVALTFDPHPRSVLNPSAPPVSSRPSHRSAISSAHRPQVIMGMPPALNTALE